MWSPHFTDDGHFSEATGPANHNQDHYLIYWFQLNSRQFSTKKIHISQHRGLSYSSSHISPTFPYFSAPFISVSLWLILFFLDFLFHYTITSLTSYIIQYGFSGNAVGLIMLPLSFIYLVNSILCPWGQSNSHFSIFRRLVSKARVYGRIFITNDSISWARLTRSGNRLGETDLRKWPILRSPDHERELGQGHRNQGRIPAHPQG